MKSHDLLRAVSAMSLRENDDADWRDVIQNNLNGTANTVRAFAPGMVKRQYGGIILLSSLGLNERFKHGETDARELERLGRPSKGLDSDQGH